MSRRLDDMRLAVMMLDGLEIAERTHIVALGISTDGVKIPLGLWEGSTENATLARSLLADLVDRGLDPTQAILFVLDGGKALRKAIKDVFGEHALVHRCHRHKERKSDRSAARARPPEGPRQDPWRVGADRPGRAPSSSSRRSPQSSSAPGPTPAASLREGMAETLTLMGLGITGNLAKTLVLDEPDASR